MARIQKAVEYFQDNSPDSPELNKVVRGRGGVGGRCLPAASSGGALGQLWRNTGRWLGGWASQAPDQETLASNVTELEPR